MGEAYTEDVAERENERAIITETQIDREMHTHGQTLREAERLLTQRDT